MRTLSVSFFILMVLSILIGCETDQQLTSVEHVPALISINNLPESVFAKVDNEAELSFNVSVMRLDGKAVAGGEVRIALNGVGSVTPNKIVLSESGSLDAVLKVTPELAERKIDVVVSYFGNVQSQNITVTGYQVPDRLKLSFTSSEFSFPFGIDGSIPFTVEAISPNNVSIPNVPIRLSLHSVNGNEEFGSLRETLLITDANGRAHSVFSTNESFGQMKLTASLDDNELAEYIRDEFTFSVTPSEVSIVAIDLYAMPNRFAANQGFINSNVNARVLDANQKGISGIKVMFTASRGNISQNATTNENGVATASLTADGTSGAIHIVSRIESIDLEAKTEVIIENEDGITLLLSSDVNSIYADSGATKAVLTAVLRDVYNVGVPNAKLYFSSTHGEISNSAITNEQGRVQIEFTDSGLPSFSDQGTPDSALIMVKYLPSNLTATKKIIIQPTDPIENVELIYEHYRLQTQTRVNMRGYARYADRKPSWLGTKIHLSSRMGQFEPKVVDVDNINGEFNATYRSSYATGLDTLYAYWVNPFDESHVVESRVFVVETVAGDPANVWLDSRNRTIDLHSTTVIEVSVIDEFGNPVKNTYVNLTTSLGTIQTTVFTNNYGIATANFYSRNVAGIATIRGEVNGVFGITSVTIKPGIPDNSEIRLENPTINARNEPGITSTPVTVNLFDVEGNFATHPAAVELEIENEPDAPLGASFPNGNSTITVESNTGVFNTSIIAGTSAGRKRLKVTAWRDEARTEPFTNYAEFTVVSNDAASVTIGIDYNAEMVGGGFWELELSALVLNNFNVPVSNGVQVIFSIEEMGIEIESTTGTLNRQNLRYPGVAYAKLRFTAEHCYEQMRLKATVQRYNGNDFERSIDINIPAQRPSISLTVDPANFRFEDNVTYATIECSAFLTDGYGNLVNNAPIRFLTNRSSFYQYNSRNRQYVPFQNQSIVLTGTNNDLNANETGQARTFLRARMEDIFTDPFTPEVLVQINAVLHGTELRSENVFINFTRN